jgi:hypothetical protein
MTAADPAVFLLDVDNILLDINTLPEKTLLAEFAWPESIVQRSPTNSSARASSRSPSWNDLIARIASKSTTQAKGKRR